MVRHVGLEIRRPLPMRWWPTWAAAPGGAALGGLAGALDGRRATRSWPSPVPSARSSTAWR